MNHQLTRARARQQSPVRLAAALILLDDREERKAQPRMPGSAAKMRQIGAQSVPAREENRALPLPG